MAKEDKIKFKNPEIQQYYEKLSFMTDAEFKEEWNNVCKELRDIYNIYNNKYNNKQNKYNNIGRTSSSVKFC